MIHSFQLEKIAFNIVAFALCFLHLISLACHCENFLVVLADAVSIRFQYMRILASRHIVFFSSLLSMTLFRATTFSVSVSRVNVFAINCSSHANRIWLVVEWAIRRLKIKVNFVIFQYKIRFAPYIDSLVTCDSCDKLFTPFFRLFFSVRISIHLNCAHIQISVAWIVYASISIC